MCMSASRAEEGRFPSRTSSFVLNVMSRSEIEYSNSSISTKEPIFENEHFKSSRIISAIYIDT